jgi:UDP-glucose 4-epimerase
MTEIMLADAAAAHELRYVALRYFNVSGADPKGRTGQSTRGAINLIKVATEAAMGKRDAIEVFGTRLSDPRRHLCPRFHSCGRPRCRPSRCAVLPASGRGQSGRQLRLWPRLHGPRGARVGAAHQRPRFRVRLGPRRHGDIVTSVADSTRARSVLGWTPRHDDIDEIVGSALAWESALTTQQPPN